MKPFLNFSKESLTPIKEKYDSINVVVKAYESDFRYGKQFF